MHHRCIIIALIIITTNSNPLNPNEYQWKGTNGGVSAAQKNDATEFKRLITTRTGKATNKRVSFVIYHHEQRTLFLLIYHPSPTITHSLDLTLTMTHLSSFCRSTYLPAGLHFGQNNLPQWNLFTLPRIFLGNKNKG